MSDLDQLALFIQQQNACQQARITGLSQVLATLISREARKHPSPDEYVMTATSPILGLVAGLEEGGAVDPAVIDTLRDLHDDLENAALDRLRSG